MSEALLPPLLVSASDYWWYETISYPTPPRLLLLLPPTGRFTNWSPDISGSMAGFRFSSPAVPTFDVPEAAPNSPGEVILTSNNAIVQKTGEAPETHCNGDQAQYYGEDGYWYSKVREG